MERPAPSRSSWVTLRVWRPQRRATCEKEPVMKKVRFIGLDVHAETIAVAVAEPGGEVRSLGMIPNHAGVDPKAGEEARTGRAAARLLRGGADGVCDLLAADGARRAMRGRGADAGAGEGGRSREDGSARCGEAGAELPSRRFDGGVGAGRGARSVARSGARAGGGEEGSAPRAAPLGQVSAAPRAPAADGDDTRGRSAIWRG